MKKIIVILQTLSLICFSCSPSQFKKEKEEITFHEHHRIAWDGKEMDWLMTKRNLISNLEHERDSISGSKKPNRKRLVLLDSMINMHTDSIYVFWHYY